MSKAHKATHDGLRPEKQRLSKVPDKAIVFFRKYGVEWKVIRKEGSKVLLDSVVSGISRRFPGKKEVYAL